MSSQDTMQDKVQSTIESTKEALSDLAVVATAKAGELASTASDKASELASTASDKASDYATTASDKVEGVDAKDIKAWWPVAAVIGALVAIGVIHKRRRGKAAGDATAED
jgi:hypothetical protein